MFNQNLSYLPFILRIFINDLCYIYLLFFHCWIYTRIAIIYSYHYIDAIIFYIIIYWLKTKMYEFHYNCKSVRSLDMNSFKETLGYYPFSMRNAIRLRLYLKTLWLFVSRLHFYWRYPSSIKTIWTMCPLISTSIRKTYITLYGTNIKTSSKAERKKMWCLL